MVSIICCTMRQSFMGNVFINYETQEWKNKELIIILNKDDMDIEIWKQYAKQYWNVSVYQLPEITTLGECLNYGIEKAKYAFIAKFDDDDYYGPNYLGQGMQAFKKKDISIVVKRSVYMYFEKNKLLTVHVPGEENLFITGGVKGATLLFRKKIYEKVMFPYLNRGEDTFFIKACLRYNFKIYSTTKANYVCVRRAEPGHHTWNVEDEVLMKNCTVVCKTDDYRACGVDHEQRTSKKIAYLTFDDGPNQATSQILDILATYKAVGTFFMLEPNVQIFPKIAQRMVNEGHAIGLHGVSHKVNIFYASKESVMREITTCRRTLKSITRMNTFLVRAPYGSNLYMKPTYLKAVNYAGYRLWDWNVDSLDWKFRDRRLLKQIIKDVLRLEKKAINPVILMHDYPETAKYLPKIISFLEKRGYLLEKIDYSLKPVLLNRLSMKHKLRLRIR
ncbi:polysaccharide deacetylase family protein [Paenibacillus psychroresistens]|uniref:polysaccharide deacetylase family protein n=1 Tax=Paenibacillus psychroresistens TaxID=1778678 RepID=UPI001391F29A|nr:polysaccharide deacetylase family protein [Paenibacillus psychroresistens]